MIVAPLTLACACTLLVGTTGLTGGSDAGAGQSPETGATDANDAAAAMFAEDWESKPTRWSPEPELVREDCSTTYQRETILAGGGRVHLVTPLAVYEDGFGGTAIPVVADSKWRWYAAPFVATDAGAMDITDELFKEGDAGTADFDDIRVYAGACPVAPTGAPHDCP